MLAMSEVFLKINKRTYNPRYIRYISFDDSELTIWVHLDNSVKPEVFTNADEYKDAMGVIADLTVTWP